MRPALLPANLLPANLLPASLLAAHILAAALLLLSPARPAGADSWIAPGPIGASSEDGRWYAIVQPVKNETDAEFLLVQRGQDRPARVFPGRGARDDTVPFKPEPGDRLVARGACRMPLEVRCLTGGQGLVLFENYGSVGYGLSLDVRDGKGAPRFTKSLAQLFSAERRALFAESVSSIWWNRGFWVDEATGDVVLLWEGRESEGGVVRVALKDGAVRDGAKSDVLARFAVGDAAERIAALERALAWKLNGTLEAAAAAADRAATPPLARLHFGKYLIEQGDERARPLFAAGVRAADPEVASFAVQHLPLALGDGALPFLQEALRQDSPVLRNSAEYALRGMGSRAVPALIVMVGDTRESAAYRAGAATALWNMDVEASLPAEAALAEAAKSELPELAYAAGHALKQIREYLKKNAAK
ncbi:MAG: hypothetical protein O2894_01435 [Planctomycetota bacterium]|nr:hypothetical protein [Planctomycetota bacterium]